MSQQFTSVIDSSLDRVAVLSGENRLGSLSLTPERLRFWGIRSVLSLTDQAFYSGGSFLLNVLLARWFSREVYGVFAVAFAGFLFLTGFHNVVFIEPMTVIGSSTYAQRLTSYFGAQLRAQTIVVGSLSAIGLATYGVFTLGNARSHLSATIVAAGISLPFLMLLWLARRMCYVALSPLVATQGSTLYVVLLLGGAFGLHRFAWITPATTFLWMGAASVLVAVFILFRLGVPIHLWSSGASPSLRRVLKENWSYGHWLTLTTILSWISVQAQTVLAAGFLGLGGAGILRAMQLPSLAMTQVIAATTLLVLPSMSLELGWGNVARLRKKAIVTSVYLTVLGALFAAVLFLFAAPLERLLFGGKYASSAWLIPVLGLVPIFTGFSSSLSLALRALRKSHLELCAYVLSAATALGLAFALMPRWGGLQGAAASIVGSTAVLAIAVLVCFMKWGTR